MAAARDCGPPSSGLNRPRLRYLHSMKTKSAAPSGPAKAKPTPAERLVAQRSFQEELLYFLREVLDRPGAPEDAMRWLEGELAAEWARHAVIALEQAAVQHSRVQQLLQEQREQFLAHVEKTASGADVSRVQPGRLFPVPAGDDAEESGAQSPALRALAFCELNWQRALFRQAAVSWLAREWAQSARGTDGTAPQLKDLHRFFGQLTMEADLRYLRAAVALGGNALEQARQQLVAPRFAAGRLSLDLLSLDGRLPHRLDVAEERALHASLHERLARPLFEPPTADD